MEIKEIKMGFHADGVLLSIDQIFPSKKIKDDIRKSQAYKRVISSVKEIGIVEPPIVYPMDGEKYMLLDGHIKLEALKELDRKEVWCIIAKDDEAYTYNHKVNRVPPIHEHYMIMKAIENGVSEEKIAKALDVNVDKIIKKKMMIDGICQQAVDLLKDREITQEALSYLKKVNQSRQIEMAEIMISANNYSVSYAKALYTSSKKENLNNPEKNKFPKGMTQEDIERMQKEMESVNNEFKTIQESHGKDVLVLIVSQKYIKRLLGNSNIVRYLSKKYLDIFELFQKIEDLKSLSQ